ncbi:MAG: hypothetical protein CMD83_17810 [Gammaproteobacteria bacterium]|nr:hypothetical protein [Gammaproteobacteria bacterium]|tara:strand:- start:2275 stop:2559 length:285 start_codon:yes stop_codon:yes gene_type:complete
MNRSTFMSSLDAGAPPEDSGSALTALWLEKRGDWDAAHDSVQASTPDNCWVHAYLHRREGDASNAAYWYRRADKPVCDASLDDEWASLVDALTA